MVRENGTQKFFRERGVVMVALTVSEAEALLDGRADALAKWARHKLSREVEAVREEVERERGTDPG